MSIGVLARVLPWQDPGVEKIKGRYFGEYLGFVRNRADPSLAGRVQVQVPALMSEDNNQENWLDWCLPSSAGCVVPPLNAPVMVTFEQGIITHGVYRWGWIQGDGEAPAQSMAPLQAKGLAPDPTWAPASTYAVGASAGPPLTATLTADPAAAQLPVYPWNKVYVSESGVVVEVDDSPGQPRIRAYHPAGANALIDSNGSFHLRTKGSIFHECEGDYVIGLSKGASFKVIYQDGSGLVLGPYGFHLTAHQASLLGRYVIRNEMNI